MNLVFKLFKNGVNISVVVNRRVTVYVLLSKLDTTYNFYRFLFTKDKYYCVAVNDLCNNVLSTNAAKILPILILNKMCGIIVQY